MSKLEGIAYPATKDMVALRHSARHLALFPRRQAAAATDGGYRSRFRGRGMDFDEVRPYQGGDDIRSIDWRVTARTNTPHTKIFREERERPVLVAVDLRSSMFFGSQRLKSLVASEVAIALAWAGIRANDRLGAMVFSPQKQRDIRGRRSHHNVLQLIRCLEDACRDLLEPLSDQNSLETITENIRRSASPGTAVVIISDFHDMDRHSEKHLFQVARHCDLTLIAVSDPLENDLPPPGIYPVRDGARRFSLNTRNSQLRQKFQQQRQQQKSALKATSNRLGAMLIELSTQNQVIPTLARYYGSKQGNGGRR